MNDYTQTTTSQIGDDRERPADSGHSSRRSDLSHQTLSSLLWVFSGSSVQYVLRTIILIILARLLTPADFGVVAAALTVAQLTEIFALLGVGPAIVQRPDLSDTHLRTGFTSSILFGVGLGALIWLFAPAIADFFQNDQVTAVLRVIIIVFPLSGVTVVAESLIRRHLRFRKLVEIEVLAYAVSYGIVGIGMALMGFGVWALVGAYIVEEITKAIALLIAQPHPKKLQLHPRAAYELFAYGAGMTITNIFNYFAVQGDNLIVGRWLGMAALGLYGRAYNLMRIPVSVLGAVLSKVLFPVMSKVQDDPKRLEIAYRRGTALIGLVVLPLSMASYVLAPELIGALLGPSWAGVVAPFRILVIGMLFRTSYLISATLARAKGAVYRSAWRQAIYAALVVGGAWAGQNWGLPGVSLGVLVALVAHFLLITQLGLSMIALSWRQLWAMHVPAIWFSLIIGSELWAVAAILRHLHAPAILILAACAAIGLPTMLLLIRLVPAYILGEDGIWLVHALLERLPRRLFLVKWLRNELKVAARP